MRTFIPILFLSNYLIITSCSNFRYIDIQVLNPGEVKFPRKNIDFIIIDPSKTGSITRDSANLPFALLAINNFNITLKKQLEQSQLIPDASIKILKTFIFSLPQENSEDSIQKFTYLDSLKKFYSNETKEAILIKYKFRILLDEWTIFPENYQLNNTFQFELSNLKTNEVYAWHQISDTQNWNKKDKTNDYSNAIIDGSKKIAESYACHIAPHWTPEERKIFYSPNRMMRKAYKYFCNNELNKAVEIWKHLYDIGTRRLCSNAAYNIALVYEMQDDLNSSEIWLVKSIQKKVNQSSREYLDIVRNRKLTRVSIDNQL